MRADEWLLGWGGVGGQVREAMEGFGAIAQLRMGRERDSGAFRGFAHVREREREGGRDSLTCVKEGGRERERKSDT